MITASHNPAPDNGLKIVEMGGEMLAVQWESYATQLANTPETGLPEVRWDWRSILRGVLVQSKHFKDMFRYSLVPHFPFLQALVDLCEKVNVPLCKSKASVIIGRDTRETGPEILAAIR